LIKIEKRKKVEAEEGKERRWMEKSDWVVHWTQTKERSRECSLQIHTSEVVLMQHR
jgi:hypothetical protein